jgi:phosphate starvation-inducible protein PhoH and related proteins
MAEKYISLEGVDLANLTGLNESNIDLIRENFKSRITLRGEKLFLKGEPEEINRLETIFKELIFLQNRQGKITQSDVNLIIDLVSDAREGELDNKVGLKREELDEVILVTKSNIVKPKTAGQKDFVDKTKSSEIVFVIGPAGTGKTYLSVAVALSALIKKTVNKIILSRPAVEAGESLGFLPGDISEKVNPYLRPLLDALEDMIPFDRLKSYFEKDIIEIIPLAYMRGRTLNNAFLILDEAQNSTATQMKMFLTRLGINSRAIITGDVTQIDLPFKQTSGLVQVQDILRGVEGIEFMYMEKKDVVRHRLVKNIIHAYEKFSNGTDKAAE